MSWYCKVVGRCLDCPKKAGRAYHSRAQPQEVIPLLPHFCVGAILSTDNYIQISRVGYDTLEKTMKKKIVSEVADVAAWATVVNAPSDYA